MERASRRAALRGQKHFLERYAPAYRVGIEAAHKHPGKSFEEIEDEIVLNYERAKPEDPLPWDHAQHAVHTSWAKLSKEISPREPGRGVRDFS